MKQFGSLVLLAAIFLAATQKTFAAESEPRLAELNAFWSEVSRSVKEGDFEGYKATCHDEGVLVSGISQTSHPLSKALARWKQGFLDTKDGKIKASVEFRFRQRLGDETTAHETGMFLYSTVDSGGNETKSYIEFEALLVKKGRWRIIMEYQKSRGTEAQWQELKAPPK